MHKHKVRVSCRAIIRRKNTLFLVRQKHQERNNEINDFWSTVGGGLDAAESLTDNLQREIKEETGIDHIKIGRLLYIQQFAGYGHEHIEFFFEILNVDQFDNIDLDKTTHGALEIDEHGFVDPKKVAVLPELLQNVCDDLDNPNTIFPILKSYL